MARPKKLIEPTQDNVPAIETFAAGEAESPLAEAVSPNADDSPTGYNQGLMGPSKFTGEALAVVCFDNQGFRNFKIAKLEIKDGAVTSVKYGDPYASFEAIGFLELLSQFSVIKCNNSWSHGKSWEISDGKF